MKINKSQIETIKLALYEAIESYDALIDAHSRIDESDKEVQGFIKKWERQIIKFKQLYQRLMETD